MLNLNSSEWLLSMNIRCNLWDDKQCERSNIKTIQFRPRSTSYLQSALCTIIQYYSFPFRFPSFSLLPFAIWRTRNVTMIICSLNNYVIIIWLSINYISRVWHICLNLWFGKWLATVEMFAVLLLLLLSPLPPLITWLGCIRQSVLQTWWTNKLRYLLAVRIQFPRRSHKRTRPTAFADPLSLPRWFFSSLPSVKRHFRDLWKYGSRVSVCTRTMAYILRLNKRGKEQPTQMCSTFKSANKMFITV